MVLVFQASPFLTKCITETLRLWPVVPNGTFRQLSHDDYVKGRNGERVLLPKGTFVQITTIGRQRDPQLWGDVSHAIIAETWAALSDERSSLPGRSHFQPRP